MLWILFLLFACANGFSKEVSQTDFGSAIKASNVSFVNFYSTYCVHCQRLKPKWVYLSGLYEELPFLQIDCYKNKALAAKYQVNRYPSIKAIDSHGNVVAAFSESRTVANLNEFVGQITGKAPKWPKSHVTKLNDTADVTASIYADNDFLGAAEISVADSPFWNFLYDQFAATNNDVIVAFVGSFMDEWLARDSFYESLATEMAYARKKVQFVLVDISNSENSKLAALLKINHFPAIFHLVNKNRHGLVQRLHRLWTGTRPATREEVQRFFSTAKFQIYNAKDVQLVYPGNEADLLSKIAAREYVSSKLNFTVGDFALGQVRWNELFEYSGPVWQKVRFQMHSNNNGEIAEESEEVDEAEYLSLREL